MSNVAKDYVVYAAGGFKKATSSADSVLFANVGATTVTIGAVVLSVVGGALDVGGVKVVNALDATSNDGLATKGQMDTADGLRVLKAGDSMSGNLTMTGGSEVLGLPSTPSGATAAASKAYVDAIAVGAKMQTQVAVATTANINLASAPSTIDGYTLQAGDRVLVKNQTTDTQNGIYDFTAAASALTRSTSLDNTPSGEIYNGVLVPLVENGTVNAGRAYAISSIGTGTAGLHTIGTDTITWTQFNSPTSITASTGVWLNGSDVEFNPDGVTLDAGGATANGTSTARIKPLGVGTASLAATSVTAAKLGSDVAGNGLSGGNGSALTVNPGDGIRLAGSATAVDYTETLQNDNASAITVGQLVYLKTNGHVDLATAVLATSDTMLMVVSAASIASGASGKVFARPGARISGFTSLTPGKKVYAHNSSAGGVTQDDTTISSGNNVYTIGRAISATDVIFDPEFIIQN